MAAGSTGGFQQFDLPLFFSQVSSGLVNAQRNLDDQSADYLKTIANRPHALPTTFRIPKVSAEFKFALDTTKGSGVNLIFFQAQKTAEEQHQQTVNFDIVAVPPPTGLVAPPAQASIVRLKSDRADILKAATSLPDPVVTDFDRVIILEIIDSLNNASPDTASRQYFLLYVDSGGANSKFNAWWLQIMTKSGVATFAAILTGAALDPTLRTFTAAAGDRQKQFLSQFS